MDVGLRVDRQAGKWKRKALCRGVQDARELEKKRW